eukprot:CAMPEP_0176497596 /NCGR_PEP_ID=MMETSP0200_2-20121128/11811_1 /TAXON_ID=947934 /ORGANISM="Chaetoceros sp., Strain GSL56" /LENGTH=150 /DNA_ID=CAMNT_0017895625 /DNA_START=1011 /DNA_END=1463 /DNA_ORIENTATION=-
MSIFFPLGGFFNIAIYCRPKVVALRTTESDISWMKAYIVVILGGGEIPSQMNSLSAYRQRRHQFLSNTQKDEEEEAQNDDNSSVLNLSNTNHYDHASGDKHISSFSSKGGGDQSTSFVPSNVGVDGMSLSLQDEDLDHFSCTESLKEEQS